eukprot:SAG22_NODE_1794_length_3558_cov_2.608557_3_plen_302_part_00
MSPGTGSWLGGGPTAAAAAAASLRRVIEISVERGPQAGATVRLGTDDESTFTAWWASLAAGARDERTGRGRSPLHRPPLPAELAALHDAKTERATAVRAADPVCAELLGRLWSAMSMCGATETGSADDGAVPNLGKSERWKDLGFQSDDPSRDFRAAGRLALRHLVHRAEADPRGCRAQNAAQLAARAEAAYPWATAGIVISDALCGYFGLSAAPGTVIRPQLLRRGSWALLRDAGALPELFTMLFELVDRRYTERGGTYAGFNPVLYGALHDFTAAVELATSTTAGVGWSAEVRSILSFS